MLRQLPIINSLNSAAATVFWRFSFVPFYPNITLATDEFKEYLMVVNGSVKQKALHSSSQPSIIFFLSDPTARTT